MRLAQDFFKREVLDVAPELLGKVLVRRFDDGREVKFKVIETEAYRGEEDLACHASKGRTKRTEALYHDGGEIYIYLIYGMYWLLNIVAGESGFPAGILVRGLEDEKANQITGPGKVGRSLMIDRSFYSENLSTSQRVWIEEGVENHGFERLPRVGVEYAGGWARKLWRYRVK